MRFLLALLLVFAFPALAFAHPGHVEAAGFVHGFEHPMRGMDHVLAMVAVGVFAFVLGGRALWLVPLSFVGMMIAGFGLGLAQLDLPFVELGIALSSVAIGAAAAMGRPMPLTGAMTLVGVFAIFHGHAHGAEMPETAGGLSYALGFVMATALLHGVGIATAMGVSRTVGKYARLVAQIAGGVFALGGIGVLAGWL